MIQDTSLKAYDSIQPKIGHNQSLVLEVIKRLNGATNAEIGKEIGWEINRVTPRVKELREKGLVRDAGKRACKVTGSESHVWRTDEPRKIYDAIWRPEVVAAREKENQRLI